MIFLLVTASSDSTQDKICVCDCSRCFCLFYQIPGELLRVTIIKRIVNEEDLILP